MWGRIIAVTINTFREAVRDRVLYAALTMTVLCLLFIVAIGELSLNEERRVVWDLGVATISLLSVFVTIFLSSSLLYKELERKTLFIVLPRPIRRGEFLLGKYLGVALTLGCFVAITASVLLCICAWQYGAALWQLLLLIVGLLAPLCVAAWWRRDASRFLPAWSLLTFAAAAAAAVGAKVAVLPLASAFVLIWTEAALLGAVAMVFAAFSRPVLSSLFTLGVWVLGRSADSMWTMNSKVLAPAIKSMLFGMAHVLPNLYLFVPGRRVLENQAADLWLAGRYLGSCVGYAALYAVVLMTLAIALFRRRDLV